METIDTKKLVGRYAQLLKAYKSLAIILDRFNARAQTADEIELEAYADSAIKRFEYSYDLTWKYLKLFLEQKHGIIQKSPKTVIQECSKLGLITDEENLLLLTMVDDRNITSHTYDEEIAREIFSRIAGYYELMNQLAQKLAP